MKNKPLRLSDDAPPVFYKYMPVKDWIPKLLSGESLCFSKRTSFNDPFDCRPSFRVGERKDVMQAVIAGLKDRGISPAKRLLAAGRASRMGDNILSMDATNSYLDELGILCLAPTWDNALMWSHYADHHKGICVAFHSNIDVFVTALPVVYQEDLPVVTAPTKKDRALYDKTFLTKDKCWEYEKEWRIIKANMNEDQRDKEFREFCIVTDPTHAKSLSDQRGAGFYKFPKEAIESVTLGMHISKPDEIFVRKAITSAGLSIPVYKIPRPSKSYSLLRY